MAIAAVLSGDTCIYAGSNHVTTSMFAFGVALPPPPPTPPLIPEALEQRVHDILLNTEALGSRLGVTVANVNISPHAASIRRALHES